MRTRFLFYRSVLLSLLLGAILISAGEHEALGQTPEDETVIGIALTHLEEDLEFSSITRARYQLVPFHSRRSLLGTHVRFYQQFDGIMIYDTQVLVHVDPDGKVSDVRSRTIRDIELPQQPPGPTPVQLEDQVLKHFVGQDVEVTLTGQMVIVRDELGDHFASNVRVRSKSGPEDWTVLVDAFSGKVLRRQSLIRRDQGLGMVYDPNPIVTLGDPTLEDQDNANSTVLEGAREQRTLEGLDGTGYLSGDFVDLTAPGIPGAYKSAGLAFEPGTLVFDYVRSDDRFEEVMVYYHLDTSQRYIQSLGFPNLVNRSIPAHAHYFADDSAFYSTITQSLQFGDGGVDDAEDADVILHEYGHAIQDDQVPGLWRLAGERCHRRRFCRLLGRQ